MLCVSLHACTRRTCSAIAAPSVYECQLTSHLAMVASAEDTYTKDVVIDGKERKIHFLDTAGHDEVGQVRVFIGRSLGAWVDERCE